MVYFRERERFLEPSSAGSSDRSEEFVMKDEYFGEENVELVDSEWADFERFIREFRERRMNALAHAKDDRRHQNRQSRSVRSQAFYPCPPTADHGRDSGSSSSSDDDEYPFGYIDTLVSLHQSFCQN